MRVERARNEIQTGESQKQRLRKEIEMGKRERERKK